MLIIDINNLRKKTGAGIVDCKKALLKSHGNFDKAISILQEKGKKIYNLRSKNSTKNGVIFIKINKNNNFGVIISLLCETDFVAKNNAFIELGENIINNIFLNFGNFQNVYDIKINTLTIRDLIINLILKLREKITIGFFYVLYSQLVISYLHEKKIGVLLGLVNKSNKLINFQDLKYIVMQIASMKPIDIQGIDKSIINNEKNKVENLKNKNKNILDLIINGKICRFIKENTLINQKFIKNNDQIVFQYLISISPYINLNFFKRLEI